MDITDTLAPNSDQLDAVDMAASGPRIFTVKSVSKGNAEQPVQVHLVEFPRGPWRPGKNMRRVLAACWGADASAWVGRRVELYCDPAVRYGADAVGGTRIRALSHIDKVQQVPLIVSRGKSAVYTVQPLASGPTTRGGDVPPAQPDGRVDSSGDGATGAPQSEPAASPEPLLAAVNRQVREMASTGGTAFLLTWCQSQVPPISPTSKAIVEAFGEAARDLRGLMAKDVTS